MVSLVVAILGGVPGVMSVIDILRKQPKLKVVPQFVMSATLIKPNSPPELLIRFGLGVSNEGERPIVPSVFDVDIFHRNKWVRMQRTFLSQFDKVDPITNHLTVTGEVRDLQTQGRALVPGLPFLGFLAVTTPKLSHDDYNAMPTHRFRFTCLDVAGKTHVAETATVSEEEIKGSIAYPSLGVIVNPKLPSTG